MAEPIQIILPAEATAVLFSAVFCQHDNLWTATLSLMKLCVNMYPDNLLLNFKVIGQKSRSHGYMFFLFCVRDTAANRRCMNMYLDNL